MHENHIIVHLCMYLFGGDEPTIEKLKKVTEE